MRIIAIKKDRTIQLVETAKFCEWHTSTSLKWVDVYGYEHFIEDVFNVVKQTKRAKLLRAFHPVLGTHDYLSPQSIIDAKELICEEINDISNPKQSVWSTLPNRETIRLAASGQKTTSQWQFCWVTIEPKATITPTNERIDN